MNKSVSVEWAVRWNESIPGLLDVSRPFASKADADRQLRDSAFDGLVVRREITVVEWPEVTS